MNRITTGGSLTIEIQPTRWRLVNNSNAESDTALVEVNYGEPLRYLPTFASSRRLPDTGVLPNSFVQRVVLGWSNEDESWHLGFLLDSELAQPRGSRWCELVHWPDPDGELFANRARQAGESLAEMMARPFYFVPPKISDEPVPEPLPPLPGKIDAWTVGTTPAGQIEMKLARESGRSRFSRAIWYFFLSILYIILSVLTLISGIALPRPEFLPFLGLAAAVLLLGISIRTLLVRGDTAIFPRDIDMVAYTEIDSASTRGGRIRFLLPDGEVVESELTAAAPGFQNYFHNMPCLNTLCVATCNGRTGAGMLDVKKALDEGSKEMKVVAIECLGAEAEDLSFLLEQSKAKAKDVRAAAEGL